MSPANQRNQPQSEINPYAPPQVGDAPDPYADIGVGVWRDGRLLVMHRNTELPRFCIHTGEAAAGTCEEELPWRFSGRPISSSVKLRLPLCRNCLRAFGQLRLRSQIGLAMMGLGAALALADEWLSLELIGFVLLFSGVALWLHAWWTLGKPLSIVHAEHDYLWLRDVHRDFLAHLPEWPYAK